MKENKIDFGMTLGSADATFLRLGYDRSKRIVEAWETLREEGIELTMQDACLMKLGQSMLRYPKQFPEFKKEVSE